MTMNDVIDDGRMDKPVPVEVHKTICIDLGKDQTYGTSQRDGKLYIGTPAALDCAGVPLDRSDTAPVRLIYTGEIRRFDIFIPVFYLDGKPVPPEVIVGIREELEEEFGKVLSGGEVRCSWTKKGEDNFVYKYEDVFKGFSVCAENTRKTFNFLRRYKLLLQDRLKNINVVIESYPIFTI